MIKKVEDLIQDGELTNCNMLVCGLIEHGPAHQRESFLDSAAMLPPVPSTEEQDTLIGEPPPKSPISWTI